MIQRIQQGILYWLLIVAQNIARWIPLSVAYGIATGIGEGAWLLLHSKRKITLMNLRYILGPDTSPVRLWQVGRNVFRNYAKYLVDFLRLPSITQEELETRIKSAGWEHLDAALHEGKGVIFASVHFGNWDFAGVLAAMRGYSVNSIAESFHNQRFNDVVVGMRTCKGLKIVPMETVAAARRVLRALRQNELLGLLIDRPMHGVENGVPVKMFDTWTAIPAGIGTLAVKSGAKIVPVALIRRPDNTFEGEISPPLDIELTGDLAQDVQRISQACISALEGYIRQYPDQWYMFRPMWPQQGK